MRLKSSFFPSSEQEGIHCTIAPDTILNISAFSHTSIDFIAMLTKTVVLTIMS